MNEQEGVLPYYHLHGNLPYIPSSPVGMTVLGVARWPGGGQPEAPRPRRPLLEDSKEVLINFSTGYNFGGVYCGQVGAFGRIVRDWLDVKNGRRWNVGRLAGCRLQVEGWTRERR